MEKNKFITILFVMALILSACDEKLNLEPKQSVGEDVIITTSDGIQNLLYGAYSGIKGTTGANEGGELFGSEFNFMSEELADDDDAQWVGTFQTHRDLFDKALTANHAMAAASWIRGYDVINMVNIVLDNIAVVDEAERDRIQGEALCIRGMLYFELARFWGLQWESSGTNSQLAVPLKLGPTYTIEDAAFVARSTVAQVYAQAISDLQDAETLLSTLGTNGTNVNTYTASAFLSRIYLQQSRFEEAAQAADRVISSGEYSLVGTPIEAFNKDNNTSEDIFAIQQNATSNAGTSNAGLTTHYASLNGHGRGDFAIMQQHIDRYETDDLRGQVTSGLSSNATFTDVPTMFYIGIDQNPGNIMIVKWANGEKNIPVVRLAEMYLTRAEGNFEAGTSHGASPLVDINRIRLRAGLTLLPSVDQSSIRNERRLELAYEGFALHDIRRWNLSVGSLPYDAPNLVLPIPERETNVNSEMVQNPGY